MDIVAEIASSHVSHYCDLEIGIVVAYHSTDILVIAELPLAEILDIEHLLGRLITELHNVHACLYIGLIQILYKFIGKSERIHKTTITQRCVHYSDI